MREHILFLKYYLRQNRQPKFFELSEYNEKKEKLQNFKKLQKSTCFFNKSWYTYSSKARWSSG